MRLLYIHDTRIDSEQANLIQVIHMCHAFANNGIEVALATPEVNGFKNKELYKEALKIKFGIDINFAIETFPKITVFGKLQFVGGYIGVRKLLKRFKADTCFIRNAAFINLVLESNMPLIYESHNTITHEGSRFFNTFWTQKILTKVKHYNFRKFITISQALSDFWLTKGIPKGKLLALHDGFDHKKFENMKNKTIARKELSLPVGRKIVMYTGSLYGDRGIEVILKLSQIFHNAFFVIVGGPESNKIEYEKISRKNNIKNITFVGHIPPRLIPDYLSAADILLMIWTNRVKTINYCSPLKTFEYMASGRVIVGHSFPTIMEILEDGETALLANPTSFNELRDKLHIALKSTSAANIGTRARSLAFQKYSWNQRAKSIINQL